MAKYHVSQRPGKVIVQRTVGSGSGQIGDASREVRPGDKFLGHTYAELRKLGSGEKSIVAKNPGKK
jgi:hypothetical protein